MRQPQGFCIARKCPDQIMRTGTLSFGLIHVALDQLGIGGRASFGIAIGHRQGDQIGEAEWFDISLDRLRWPTPSPIQDSRARPYAGRRRRFRIVHNVLKSGNRLGGESLRSLLHVVDDLPSLDSGGFPWTSTWIAALATLPGGRSFSALRHCLVLPVSSPVLWLRSRPSRRLSLHARGRSSSWVIINSAVVISAGVGLILTACSRS